MGLKIFSLFFPLSFSFLLGHKALLPRIMKFKLKRLLDIRIPSPKVVWTEGEKASVVIVVSSHVPCTLPFDSCVMELVLDGTEDSEVPVTLRMAKDGPIEIPGGETSLTVEVEDVHAAGRFKVVSVSLIMGKLKLSTQIGDQTTGPAIRSPYPMFLSKSVAPLLLKVRRKKDLVILNGHRNGVEVVLIGGPNGYEGKVDVQPTLVFKEGARRDVDVKFSLSTMSPKDSKTDSIGLDLNLRPNESTSVRFNIQVDRANNQLAIMEDSETTPVVDVVVRTVVTASFVRSGEERHLVLTKDSDLQFCQPLQFIASLGQVDHEKCLLTVAIRNATKEMTLRVLKTFLDVPQSVGSLDPSEGPHADLLPAAIGSGSAFSVVYFFERNRSGGDWRNGEDDAYVATIHVDVVDGNDKDVVTRTVKARIDVSALQKLRSHFKVGHSRYHPSYAFLHRVRVHKLNKFLAP